MAILVGFGVGAGYIMFSQVGHYLRSLNGKPAALVMRLAGKSIEHPSVTQCAELGKALGHLHVVGQEFTEYRENLRGPHWWRVTAKQVMPKLDDNEAKLLQDELLFQKSHRLDTLPRGVIHADLFRDNALYSGDKLTGIIDFYYACNDVLLYDVAVTVNDWCCHEDGSLDEARLHALLEAYKTERSFSEEEIQAWPMMLRAGALRFWLSRLQDKHFPREGEITHIKDPTVFQRILEQRIEQQAELTL